jgi:hypothetical protein
LHIHVGQGVPERVPYNALPPVASGVPKVPVEGGAGKAVVSPAVGTLRDEMAVSGQRLLAVSGQIPMAAHSRRTRGAANIVPTTYR